VVISPDVVILATRLVSLSVNQRLPSGPATMSLGFAPAAGYSAMSPTAACAVTVGQATASSAVSRAATRTRGWCRRGYAMGLGALERTRLHVWETAMQ
jgi:hypothetical protein